MTEERLARILYLFSNYWETRGHDKETWGLFCISGGRTGNKAEIDYGALRIVLD